MWPIFSPEQQCERRTWRNRSAQLHDELAVRVCVVAWCLHQRLARSDQRARTDPRPALLPLRLVHRAPRWYADCAKRRIHLMKWEMLRNFSFYFNNAEFILPNTVNADRHIKKSIVKASPTHIHTQAAGLQTALRRELRCPVMWSTRTARGRPLSETMHRWLATISTATSAASPHSSTSSALRKTRSSSLPLTTALITRSVGKVKILT